MTQTNTDYLLQITPAVTDRTYGAAAANDDGGKFDDHLSQAAMCSGEDSSNRGSSSQRIDTASHERDDRSWNTSASNRSNNDSGTSISSQTSPADQEQSADAVSGSKPPAEDADDDKHEAEKPDDTTAGEVAGASQVTKDNSQKTNTKSELDANAEAVATAKDAAVSKKAANEAGDPKAKVDAAVQVSGSPLLDAATEHAGEATEFVAVAAIETATTEEAVDASPPRPSEHKQSKAVKSDASTAKSNKAGRANNDVAVSNDLLVDEAATGQISSEVAQEVNDHLEASATLADATETKGKSGADDPSDDESRTSSHSETRVGARNEASGQTNKFDTAQLAVSISSQTDAGTNTASKDKEREPGTKRIVAKSEPPAAAFARMTRNNITGSNDSASGENDLPPVDPSRFIGRVAKAFQTAQDRGGTLQLRLSPPELGALRIELNVKDGVMSASLQTENTNARRLLLDHLPALRDRLAEQNIRVDRFDVDVRREGAGEQADARGSQHQHFEHQPDQPAPRRLAPPQLRTREAAAPERMAIAPSVSDTGLNLIV
jgi:flagellar hook-length control protein FliK